jgi:hypothetical protein
MNEVCEYCDDTGIEPCDNCEEIDCSLDGESPCFIDGEEYGAYECRRNCDIT